MRNQRRSALPAAKPIYFEGGYDFICYALSPAEMNPSTPASGINSRGLRKEYGDEMAGFALGRFDITRMISLEAGIRYSLFLNRNPNTVCQYAAGLPLSNETITDSTQYARGKP